MQIDCCLLPTKFLYDNVNNMDTLSPLVDTMDIIATLDILNTWDTLDAYTTYRVVSRRYTDNIY